MIYKGYIRKCKHSAFDPHTDQCVKTPAIIILADEAEMEQTHIRARIQCGSEETTNPWTERQINQPLEELYQYAIEIFRKPNAK